MADPGWNIMVKVTWVTILLSVIVMGIVFGLDAAGKLHLTMNDMGNMFLGMLGASAVILFIAAYRITSKRIPMFD